MGKIRSKWTMVFFKRTMPRFSVSFIIDISFITRIHMSHVEYKSFMADKNSSGSKISSYFQNIFLQFFKRLWPLFRFLGYFSRLEKFLRSFASCCCVFRPKFFSSSENSVIVSGMVGSSSSFFDGDDDDIKVFTAFPGWPADNKVFALSEVSSSRIDYTGSKLDKRNYRNRYSLERHSVKQPAPNDGYIWRS